MNINILGGSQSCSRATSRSGMHTPSRAERLNLPFYGAEQLKKASRGRRRAKACRSACDDRACSRDSEDVRLLQGHSLPIASTGYAERRRRGWTVCERSRTIRGAGRDCSIRSGEFVRSVAARGRRPGDVIPTVAVAVGLALGGRGPMIRINLLAAERTPKDWRGSRRGRRLPSPAARS